MSKAPRPATWKTRSSSCAGQVWWLGQRRSLSPSFSSTSVVPQDSHSVGITHSARPSGRSAEHRAEDLRDHVAGLAQDHGVAGADVLAPHLVGVVQRRALDRGAGDLGRLHHPERRDPAGAAGVGADLEELGVDLLGRVLVGDRPARRPARRPQPALQADVVDLDHDAVDLVLDVVAVLAVVLDELLDRLEALDHLHPVAGRQAPGLQGGVRLGLGRGLEALASADAVADHAQGAGGGDLGVLLAQRAGRGVAGVGEHRLAGVDHRLVEPLERLDGQEHLAAHLDQRRHRELLGTPSAGAGSSRSS